MLNIYLAPNFKRNKKKMIIFNIIFLLNYNLIKRKTKNEQTK
jgi:hypothetical protein